MNFFLNKLIKLNTVYVIGIFKNDDGDSFSLLKIKKNKGQLDIVEKFTFSDFESLSQQLDKKTPVLIVIDGKGILTKKIDLKNDIETQWLKNLDYDSIYFTSYKNEETEFLSFCRKNVVVDYVEIFNKAELQIMDFYIGPISSILLKEDINTTSFYSNQTLLEFAGETLVAVTKSDKIDLQQDYKIGQTALSNLNLPLYGAAINFYINHSSITKSHIDKISQEEIIYKKAFEKLGAFLLVGFFILLLVSYSLIQYFIGENGTLNLENSYTNKSYDLIKELESKRENKLKILSETGFSSRKFISYYCYELAKSAPQEVSLSFLDVYPVKKEIKKTEKVEFDYKTILLKGQTGNKLVFNSWIDYLKSQKWAKTLEIVSIKRDKKDITYFELKIIISDV